MSSGRDPTNMKNQSELNSQIAELRAVVETQGAMLKQLLQMVEGRTASSSRHRNVNGKGKTRDG